MENGLKQDLNRAGMTLLMLLLLQNLLTMLFLVIRRGLYFFNGYGFSSFANLIAPTLIYCATMLFAIFFGAWAFRCEREFLFPLSTPRSDYLYPAIGTGLGVGMAGSALVTLLTALLAFGGIQVRENVPTFGNGIGSTLFTVFSVSVLPAILEELLFRGVLLQPLRRYGDRIAILLSALMFALCHTSLPQAVNAFIMGLCFGIFAVRSGSLLLPMSIHLIYNGTACMVTLLSISLPAAPAAIISWLVIFALLALGVYGSRLLRKRFGSVWWVSPDSCVPVRGRQVAFSAFCSLPFMLALLLSIITIFRSIYIY